MIRLRTGLELLRALSIPARGYELGEAIGVAPGVAIVSGSGVQEAGASVMPAIGVPAMPLSIRTIEPEPSFAPIAGIET